MTLRKKLDRPEEKQCGGGAEPLVIYRCDFTTGEPFKATISGQGTFARLGGETVQDSKQRIENELA